MAKKVYTFEAMAQLTGTISVLADTEAEAKKIADTLAEQGAGAWTPDQNPAETIHTLAFEEEQEKADRDHLEQAQENTEEYLAQTEDDEEVRTLSN